MLKGRLTETMRSNLDMMLTTIWVVFTKYMVYNETTEGICENQEMYEILKNDIVVLMLILEIGELITAEQFRIAHKYHSMAKKILPCEL